VKSPEADAQWLANVVRFAVNTGLRKSKLLGRTTAHLEVDGDRALIRVGRDKNGDAISLQLFEDCKAVALAKIEAARFARKPVLLLPGPSGGRADSSVRRHLEAAVERLAEKRPDLGIRWGTDGEGITFHAFRRTFATEARRQGANLDEIKKLGNWRNSRMPEAYIQMEDERSAELLGKMARSFKTDTNAESEVSGDEAAAG
jgi:integrase